jgi:hypothetical protein
MDRFEFQLAMLQKGAEELEKKIAALTQILLQLKTAAITIWVALIGWALTTKVDSLVPVGYVIIFCFWLLEAMYWRVQCYCMIRATALAQYLNNQDALDESFNNRSIPEGLVFPLQSLKTMKGPSLLKALRAPSIYIFYTFLFIVNSIVWFITLNIR